MTWTTRPLTPSGEAYIVRCDCEGCSRQELDQPGAGWVTLYIHRHNGTQSDALHFCSRYDCELWLRRGDGA